MFGSVILLLFSKYKKKWFLKFIRRFHKNLKQSPGGVVQKTFCENLAKSPVNKVEVSSPAILLKRDFSTDNFMWVLRNFSGEFFNMWALVNGLWTVASSYISERIRLVESFSRKTEISLKFGMLYHSHF